MTYLGREGAERLIVYMYMEAMEKMHGKSLTFGDAKVLIETARHNSDIFDEQYIVIQEKLATQIDLGALNSINTAISILLPIPIIPGLIRSFNNGVYWVINAYGTYEDYKNSLITLENLASGNAEEAKKQGYRGGKKFTKKYKKKIKKNIKKNQKKSKKIKKNIKKIYSKKIKKNQKKSKKIKKKYTQKNKKIYSKKLKNILKKIKKYTQKYKKYNK